MSDTPKIEAQIELTGWQEVELVYERLAEKGEASLQRVDDAAKSGGTSARESARSVQAYSQKLGETSRDDLDLADTTRLLEDKNRLRLAIDGLKDAVGSAFFPVLAKGTDATAKFLNDNSEKIEEYIEDAADKFGKLQDDFFKLFEQPKQARRLNVEIDGRGIDFAKTRLQELVAAARAGQIGVDEVARVKPSLTRPVTGEEEDEEDPVEAAEEQAAELKTVRLSELYDYIAIAGRKIQKDQETQRSFVEIDGQRVVVARENSAKILAGLADDAEAALARQNASSVEAANLNYGFMKALYAPAQELRAIALDVWQAISGEGFGTSSRTVPLVLSAWETGTGYLIRFRDALLGVFGLTYSGLPTMGQAFDKVLDTLSSFKAGLFGAKGQAAIPWAQSAGKGLAYLGEVISSVWTVTKSVFGFVGPYIMAALNVVGDAFRALADYIKGNPIANKNTFAFLQQYIPDIEAGFAYVKDLVLQAVKYIRTTFNKLFENVGWDDVKAAAKATFDFLVAAAVASFNVIVGAFNKLKAVFDVLIVPIDAIAKLLGFEGWKTGFLAFLAAKLLMATFVGDGLMWVLGKIFWAILPGLILGVIGVVGVIAGLVAMFGALPLLIAGAVVAALAVVGALAYKYADEIKAAFGAAADWVVEKWGRLKKIVGGALSSVKRALGLGGDEAEEEAAPVAPEPAIEQAPQREMKPTDYVLGTDGEWRSAEEEEARTRPDYLRLPAGGVRETSFGATLSAMQDVSHAGDGKAADGVRETSFGATLSAMQDESHAGDGEAVNGVREKSFWATLSEMQDVSHAGDGKASAKQTHGFVDTMRDLTERLRSLSDGLGAGTPFTAGMTRRAKGTINPIENGAILRMGSGRKRDVTRHAQRLLSGTIRTEDIWPLPLSGTWKGAELDIDYPGELVEPIGTPQQRPAVPGTLVFHDAFANEVDEADAVARVYRPRLHVMLMTPWKQEDDDWGAGATSSIEWEEQPPVGANP